jgi:dTDP-4-dehydrorhamnose 3,5-epimerase
MYQPNIINGGHFEDERGKLTFINDFDMAPVKRFYTIRHESPSIVRAWQGHMKEQKWFYVLEGAFKIVLVQPDNWSAPLHNLPVQVHLLTAEHTQVLHVPGGFATGFRAELPNSRMIIYSDMSLQESKNDDFRFDSTLWYQWE